MLYHLVYQTNYHNCIHQEIDRLNCVYNASLFFYPRNLCIEVHNQIIVYYTYQKPYLRLGSNLNPPIYHEFFSNNHFLKKRKGTMIFILFCICQNQICCHNLNLTSFVFLFYLFLIHSLDQIYEPLLNHLYCSLKFQFAFSTQCPNGEYLNLLIESAFCKSFFSGKIS